MDQLVRRINALYHKSKNGGLTEDEKKEQALLRREYIDRVKNNLIQTLENTSFVDEDGNEITIRRKSKEDKPIH